MACDCGKIRKCKECQTRYNQAWYIKNKEAQLARCTERRKRVGNEVKEFIRLEKSKPCTDCKNAFPPCAMDFDHLRDKLVDLNVAVKRNWPIERVKEEIAKCELVCAVCHRIRTQNRLCPSSSVGSEPRIPIP